MKNKKSNLLLLKWIGASLLLSIAVSTAMANSSNDCDFLLGGYVNLTAAPDFHFKGLTVDGHSEVDKVAAALQHTEHAYNQVIEGQEAFLENSLAAMATRNNLLSLGPPGAAKTMGVQFLVQDIWTKQVTEWTTPFEIFGGQTKAGIEAGRETINTDGSALNEPYTLIDEINNANPQLLGALLSYLNPGERVYYVGGKPFKAKTRTVFSTGNATRTEILNSFIERQLQSGPAMLNRFLMQNFAGNWRHDAQQARLDEHYTRIERLKLLKRSGTQEQKAYADAELKKVQAQAIDMNIVEMLGTLAFEESPLLKASMREFVNALRKEMNTKVMARKIEKQSDPKVADLDPKTEWTERVRAALPKVIRYTAALDLLRLPKAQRDELLKKPIVLTPLSLWRSVYAAIMIGEGMMFFDLPNAKMQFNVIKQPSYDGATTLGHFSLTTMKELARDPREAQQWDDLDLEQTVFNDTLNAQLMSIAEINKLITAMQNTDDDAALNFENADFENVVYGYRWAKLAKTLHPQQ